ncbi:MAG: Asp-tRNA(Asn)/Glu-tRNA(Gln) amidotransferase subunit GatC [Candidatus Nomurabacteria bacterium]|nr:Asp-tRNA(Asn)/Glu-tRNA(Gln) amidotransferase subunit GatC [Candidatus Nomurabacteria bacterium]
MSAKSSIKVDQTVVAHLASLSSISLSDKDLARLTVDLKNIVDDIDRLSELDTTGVEPTFQLADLSSVWCEDIVKPQVAREKLLALASVRTETAVKVPKVL